MTRQEMIDALMWNYGGMGYGICSFTGWAIQSSMRPKSKEDDWKSVVAISGNPEDYTDEELEKLVAFSQEATADYDTRWYVRMGCNLICIKKIDENLWMRKRQSWEYGPMYSKSLDEAIQVFMKDMLYHAQG